MIEGGVAALVNREDFSAVAFELYQRGQKVCRSWAQVSIGSVPIVAKWREAEAAIPSTSHGPDQAESERVVEGAVTLGPAE